ncbi:hypothetical protein ACT6QG_05315 [Xanthobacter sp. TB0136]|uniref:hypothetical protein n=1 Tax=Xanthobacter sp. TB0136 TaxID=3459177 RepID=UPI0040397F4B
MLKVQIKGNGLERFEQAVKTLGEGKAKRAFRMAINQAGRDTRKPTYDALADQTGLKKRVTRKALKAKTASANNLSYTLTGRGGDIGLKHFGGRETRKGVSAAPWNKRQVFDGTFMKGGLFPKRKTLNLNGHAYEPNTATNKWGRKFTKAKSGLTIPQEMVKDITAETFERVGQAKLGEHIPKVIAKVTNGVITGGR